MNLEVENVFRVILLTLIAFVVGIEIGNPQKIGQQFNSVQASTPGVRQVKFRTRQPKNSVQRVYSASRRRD